MAPNLVTLLGFIGPLIAFFIVCYCDENLENALNVPLWAYYLNAALLFYYQTMDAIDGKHARNTKSSSALGELFDHGLDALNTMLQSIIVLSTLQTGPTYVTCILAILIYVTSYLVIWEDYVTDELRFGLLNSPTEAILLAVAVLVVTGVMGHEFWKISIYGISIGKWFAYASTLMAFSAIYDTTTTVLKKANSGKNERANDIGKLAGALEALIPFVTLVILYAVYAYFAPLLVYKHIVPFICSYSLIASYLQTRLILARVCREKVPIFYAILYPLPLVVINAIFFKYYVEEVHTALIAYILACYSHLIYNAISEISLILGIECFTQNKHEKVEYGFSALTYKKSN